MITLKQLASRIETVRRDLDDIAGNAPVKLRVNGCDVVVSSESFTVDDDGTIVISDIATPRRGRSVYEVFDVARRLKDAIDSVAVSDTAAEPVPPEYDGDVRDPVVGCWHIVQDYSNADPHCCRRPCVPGTRYCMDHGVLRHVERRKLLGRNMPVCPECGSGQVQLTGYMGVQPAEWKCRTCKVAFKFEPVVEGESSAICSDNRAVGESQRGSDDGAGIVRIPE